MTEQGQILRENGSGTDASFIYFLHHEGAFDQAAFWRLYNAITDAARATGTDGVSLATAKLLHDIHTQVLACFIRHLSGDEPLVGFPEAGQLEWYLERLEMAVDGYFTGIILDERAWSQIQGLKNPAAGAEG